MKRYLNILVGLTTLLLISLLFTTLAAADDLRIVGQITNINDESLENATVEIMINDTLINTTSTNEKGNFSFENIEPGNYTVKASYGKYTSHIIYINITQTNLTTNGSISNGIIIIQINVGDDSDSDGLPDNWEMHYGFDPTNPNDASVDTDGDGLTNFEEYKYGTDPTEPESYPCSPPQKSKEENESTSTLFCAGIIIFIVIILIIIFVIAYQYSKITSKKLMNHETRQKILENIKEEPGSHLRGIKKDLGLSMGVLQHHIGILEREEMVKSRFDNGNRRYYPYKFNIEKKPLLKGSQKKIVKLIKDKPGIGPNKIASTIGKSRKTVYYHITELEAKGLIWVDKSQKNHKCFMKIDT